MEGLLSICNNEGIDLYYEDLTRRESVLGWYIPAEDGEPPTIMLDKRLVGRVPLKRTVLAEELGHHFTVPRGSLARGPFFSTIEDSLIRISNSKDEERAIRWATDYLIPTPDLAKAVQTGRKEPHELAEYFCVIEWIVWRKIHFLRQDVWKKFELRIGAKEVFSPLLVREMWGWNEAEHVFF